MDTPTVAQPVSARETQLNSDPKLATPPAQPKEWRKPAGVIISVLVIFGAIVLTLRVWDIIEHHPRTDDAIARANVVAITPRVRGEIINLNVQDNQAVAAGDVLFEIDPADYELTLQKAKAALAMLDQQVEVARAQDAQLKFQVKAAEAAVERAKVELKQAGDTLERVRPLLTNGFVKADEVDRLTTARQVALAGLASEEQRLNQAQAALSTLATLIAQRPGAVAAVDLAALELSYCKVTAPFPGRVISLNISKGAYASAGVPVFSLLDTRKWYVMANFREGELRHFGTGTTVDVYLSAVPKRHFVGKVQGIGWAVEPTDAIDIPHGLPYVKRELNWVHIAQRFPVRIEIENPDEKLFRMGASAVAIIKQTPVSP
jgi:multidrug efflux system membrane fusion protein